MITKLLLSISAILVFVVFPTVVLVVLRWDAENKR